MNELKSIHDLDPIESGGSAGQKGYLFQDHVAASWCLDMVRSKTLCSVWCETLDDITLIRIVGGQEHVEFIQAKAGEDDSAWSLHRLCKREKKRGAKQADGIGTSVLEKSLRHDRCFQPCTFRIVSLQDVKSELRVLTSDLNCSARSGAKMRALKTALEERLKGALSLKSHDAMWWADNAIWCVEYSIETIQNKNLLLLEEVLEEFRCRLYSDQRATLYDNVLVRVRNASRANKSLNPSAGKLQREGFTSWLQEKAERLMMAGRAGGGIGLQKKLVAAGLDEDTIASAHESRRRYLGRRLQSGYLDVDRIDDWEDAARARMQRLRAELNSGEINESGVQFHKRTLENLEGLRKEIPIQIRPPEALLQGCMYSIVDLCQHAFVRVDL